MLFSEHPKVVYSFAVTASIIGTWLLQAAWRSPARNWYCVIAGWGAVFASLYAWSLTTARDKGIALGITAWLVIVLLFLLHAAITSPPNDVRSHKRKSTKPNNRKGGDGRLSLSQAAQNALSVIVVGPLAGTASMVLSALLLIVMQAFNVEYTANLAIVSILFPIFWACLAVITLAYQQALLTRLLTVTSIGLSSLVCILLIR